MKTLHFTQLQLDKLCWLWLQLSIQPFVQIWICIQEPFGSVFRIRIRIHTYKSVLWRRSNFDRLRLREKKRRELYFSKSVPICSFNLCNSCYNMAKIIRIAQLCHLRTPKSHSNRPEPAPAKKSGSTTLV